MTIGELMRKPAYRAISDSRNRREEALQPLIPALNIKSGRLKAEDDHIDADAHGAFSVCAHPVAQVLP